MDFSVDLCLFLDVPVLEKLEKEKKEPRMIIKRSQYSPRRQLGGQGEFNSEISGNQQQSRPICERLQAGLCGEGHQIQCGVEKKHCGSIVQKSPLLFNARQQPKVHEPNPNAELHRRSQRSPQPKVKLCGAPVSSGIAECGKRDEAQDVDSNQDLQVYSDQEEFEGTNVLLYLDIQITNF